MSTFLVKFISTFGFVGYLPVAPGTYASIAGLLIYLFIKDNPVVSSSILLLVIVTGFLITTRAEKVFNKKDASCIVIDEVAGMLVSLMFLPSDPRVFMLAFLVFRLLDILKPYPADRLQYVKGSAGIMSDDLVVGLYTNALIQIGLRLATLRTS